MIYLQNDMLSKIQQYKTMGIRSQTYDKFISIGKMNQTRSDLLEELMYVYQEYKFPKERKKELQPEFVG